MPLTEIGAKAKINISQESREWGYNPAPEGTVVDVIGFSEIWYGHANFSGLEPGVYNNYCWPIVRFPDGKEQSISICHIESLDGDRSSYWDKKTRLRDLPETKFWEDDLIFYSGLSGRNGFPEGRARIVGVKYEYIGRTREDGSPMPLYDISDRWPSGWHTWDNDWDKWELIERGKVWKYRHKEPISWSSDEEHARFLSAIGEKEDLRNPKDDLYRWTKEEALQALRDGFGHAISVTGGLFGGGPSTQVIRFKDEDLGNRIRLQTLTGFSAT